MGIPDGTFTDLNKPLSPNSTENLISMSLTGSNLVFSNGLSVGKWPPTNTARFKSEICKSGFIQIYKEIKNL